MATAADVVEALSGEALGGEDIDKALAELTMNGFENAAGEHVPGITDLLEEIDAARQQPGGMENGIAREEPALTPRERQLEQILAREREALTTMVEGAAGQDAGAAGEADAAGQDAGAAGDADGAGQDAGAAGEADGAGQDAGAAGEADAAGQDAGAAGEADGAGQDAGAAGDADAAGQDAGAAGEAAGAGQDAGAAGEAAGAGQDAGAAGEAAGAGQGAGAAGARQDARAAIEAARRHEYLDMLPRDFEDRMEALEMY